MSVTALASRVAVILYPSVTLWVQLPPTPLAAKKGLVFRRGPFFVSAHQRAATVGESAKRFSAAGSSQPVALSAYLNDRRRRSMTYQLEADKPGEAMRRLIAFLFAAIALAQIPALAVVPFSWAFALENRGTLQPPDEFEIVVPDRMFWVVRQVSGYANNGTPVVSIGPFDRASGPSGDIPLLYITPQLVVVNEHDDSWAVSYTASVWTVFHGRIRASLEPQSTFGGRFALSGYLTPSLAGDFTGDDIVNAADYAAWRDDSPLYWGNADYAAFRAGYGTAAPVAPSAPVPEPNSLAVAIGCLSVFIAGRSKRRLPQP